MFGNQRPVPGPAGGTLRHPSLGHGVCDATGGAVICCDATMGQGAHCIQPLHNTHVSTGAVCDRCNMVLFFRGML
jgi:hypothetical protein